jgi:transcription elongation factor Elf1
MLQDVECPYCEAWQEINHDDGYGYCEGELYEQECPECGKVFGYETIIDYSYSVIKLPCSNGEDHCLEDYKVIPHEFGVGKKRCKWCGEIITVDINAHNEAVGNYMNDLKNDISKGFDNFNRREV